MNVELRPRSTQVAPSRLGIADCDIHHSPRNFDMLLPYLEKRWHEPLKLFGQRQRQGNASGPQFPKSQPDASRRDAWPPEGGRPGSSLSFMQTHHLDANNVVLGILAMIRPHPGGFTHLGLSAAMARAINDWQIAEWTSREKRLKASIVVPYEDAVASVAEIDRWAGHPDVVQILLLSRTIEPLGNPRYWPIYEAAARTGLPIGIHAFGNGGLPTTSTGFQSHYIEDMVGHSQSCQSMVSSMVIEGIFERFPKLRVVLIESGFAWLPPLSWRLDKTWRTLRAETPDLKRLPSEYIRDHIWVTTQPMEEPDAIEHLRDTIEWIGWDRMLFATDYPHWDFDDPAYAMKLRITPQEKEAFFIGNARALYTPGEA